MRQARAVASALEANQFLVWEPNNGPQFKFVGSVEREVLYGGAAGSGKSDGLLMCAAMEYQNKYHRAIIFRRTFPELKDLIRRSQEIYPYLGGRYLSSRKEWFFKSGAIIEFGYIDRDAQLPKYKRAWNFIGFDELTHWPTDVPYKFLAGRLRATTGTNLRLRIRSTTNPGGVGHSWVRQRFNIPDEGSTSEVYDRDTATFRLFIPARIADNPYLAGTSYETDLNALDEASRRMLRDGRWDIVEGAMYAEYDPRRHTCDAFAVSQHWEMWRGADDGFNAPACVLWAVRHDKRIYIVGELYRNKMHAELMAEETMRRDLLIPVKGDTEELTYNTRRLCGPIDSSAFNETGVGNSNGTGRGQIMNNLGCQWEPAQKGPGSRIASVNLIHSAMKPLADGYPGLIIFRNCKNLIRTVAAIPKDTSNPEDVDTDFEDDHAHDALKYTLQYKRHVITQRKLTGH